MLKKYWKYISIFFLLIATIIFFKKDNTSSISEDNKFHIENISLINKIFLADRSGNTITLTKKGDTWIVNDKFPARKDAINVLLSTANKIRIKKPVSKAAFENIVKQLATSSVYVEFFNEDTLLKSYFIGSNTPDHLASYMLLKDSQYPFAVHIPSFNGFLSPRYGIQGNTIDVMKWRSNTIFQLSFKDINYLKYTDLLDKKNSYVLKTNPIALFNSQNKSVKFNHNNVLTLLNNFESLNCESYKKEKDKYNLENQIEELIVNSDTLRTYKISKSENKSKKDNFTVERKYATINNGELMLIQDYVFNKVLININELKK
ncbi:MAG: hypothetical protein CMD14_07475 [Flavobacteriales bacterium]|nr:hypothetical protein [Flavobacteriales bacterium]|tara:strand:- start:16288 stop:17241 length:954 start_codon:yes stop_codon:yes gene_type:complete